MKKTENKTTKKESKIKNGDNKTERERRWMGGRQQASRTNDLAANKKRRKNNCDPLDAKKCSRPTQLSRAAYLCG